MIKTPNAPGLENDEGRAAAEAEFVRAGVTMISSELEREGVKFADFVDEWIERFFGSRGAPEETIRKLRESWRRISSKGEP